MTPVDRILATFEAINRVPRCSHHEEAIGMWLLEWAAARGLAAERDAAGNVLIRVPAMHGLESALTVVVQGHMDMVCEKTPASAHNFDTDPIPLVRDGEWLRAHDTTLGADNGIAVAIALTLAESDCPHPPLELLITATEETGLVGAQRLAPGWVTGRELLNLDSEGEGVFTVGCAGGRDTNLTLAVERTPAPPGSIAKEIVVSGLEGGHSGIDIHRNRANANQLLARILADLTGSPAAVGRVAVASVDGGSARNAIARDAAAVVAVPPEAVARLETTVRHWQDAFRREYRATDPRLAAAVRDASPPTGVLVDSSSQTLVDLLAAMPHGVLRMSDEVPGLVETSTNFASVRTGSGTVEIATSQRSSSPTRLTAAALRIESLARLAGAAARGGASYPPWEPDMDSELLARAQRVYRAESGKDPAVQIIHAGLECGVIGAKYPGMQMISIGPTIDGAHSPDERLYLPSLERIWRFVTALLSDYGPA